jgi:uncharacterized phage infection (PIP) family protein YhgE
MATDIRWIEPLQRAAARQSSLLAALRRHLDMIGGDALLATRDMLNGIERQQQTTQSLLDRLVIRAPLATTDMAPDPDVQRRLDSAIEAAESLLDELGDEAQDASGDLQDVLQKQQQLVQMLSTISKHLHDTAAATIQKLG